MLTERAVVFLQAQVRGWLARCSFRRVKSAVVLLQCCVRRRAARKELLHLRAEARSVEKYRELNKGMEVKLMQLQLKADQQVRRWKKALSNCVMIFNYSGTESAKKKKAAILL